MGSTEVILVLTVVIWALNVSVTKYILTQGFEPLSYAAVRYGLAALVFVAITLSLERSLRVGGRRSLGQVGIAVAALYVNQICFVYALELTTATTVSLLLGTMPIISGLLGTLTGLEHLSSRFWLAATVCAAGVALVALGSGGDLSGDLGGVLAALGMVATWSVYSVAIVPLMRTYSPYRISTVVLGMTFVALATTGAGQLADQDFDFGWLVWLGLVFAVVGPLVVTNILWYTAVHRVGPARATLVVNLQPFVGAVFAVILLSEPLSAWQIVGGVLIAAGLLLAGRHEQAAPPAE
jgi:drug/metabolite transporter (DMT)-like permease